MPPTLRLIEYACPADHITAHVGSNNYHSSPGHTTEAHVSIEEAHGPSILGREIDRCLWPKVDFVILILWLTTWEHQCLLLLG